jgi:hypothetical protein
MTSLYEVMAIEQWNPDLLSEIWFAGWDIDVQITDCRRRACGTQ